MILWNILVILGVLLVSFPGVRPMKPFFVPPLIVFMAVLSAVAVYADQYGFADISTMRVTSSAILDYSVPNENAAASVMVRSGERLVIPVPYTTQKPSETLLTPLSPMQDFVPPTPGIFLGQERTMDEVEGILATPLPPAKGPAPDGMFDSKLVGSPDASDSDFDALEKMMISKHPDKSGASGTQTQPSDSLSNGVLMLAMMITTLGLIYMAFIAYDYRQRWMHSLTAQNDRYLVGGTFDMDTEETYGSTLSFSDNFGFPQRAT